MRVVTSADVRPVPRVRPVAPIRFRAVRPVVLAVLERRVAAGRRSGWLLPFAAEELEPRSETEPVRELAPTR